MLTPEEFDRVLLGVQQRMVLKDVVDSITKKKKVPTIVEPVDVVGNPYLIFKNTIPTEGVEYANHI